jgi:hypothetical protein
MVLQHDWYCCGNHGCSHDPYVEQVESVGNEGAVDVKYSQLWVCT